MRIGRLAKELKGAKARLEADSRPYSIKLTLITLYLNSKKQPRFCVAVILCCIGQGGFADRFGRSEGGVFFRVECQIVVVFLAGIFGILQIVLADV